MNNRFKHFFIKQKSDTAVIIQCLFETIDESVEEEAEAIFNVLFLSTRFDVVLTLENPAYITPKFITLLLVFARVNYTWEAYDHCKCSRKFNSLSEKI
ncbi:MAG: hypothetical protein IPO06_07485 [Leptospiraceae bacterium]|nr:hypothetical protein [Leptospiraceae bacterium]